MRPGTFRKADAEPGNLVRVALNRLDGLGRPARGKQCLAMLEPISTVTVPMKFMCAMLSASRKKMPAFDPSLLPMQNTVPPVSETPI
jgi:hypothetical protein